MCNCKEQIQSLKDTVASQESRINILTRQVEDLVAISPEADSHQIVALFDADDRAFFNLVTGLGTDRWLGWAICNGATYNLPQGGTKTTPALVDAIPVGGGNIYVVGEVLSPKLDTTAGTVKLFGLLYVMKIY